MGRFKEMILEQDVSNHANVPDKLVAVHLFKNKLVREFAFQHRIDGVCDYCGKQTEVLPLSTIVKEIDRIIMEYFGNPDDEGLGWDSTLDRDPVLGFRTEGGGYIIPNNRTYYDEMSELLFKNGFAVESESLLMDITSALGYHTCLVEQDPYGLNEAEIRWVDWKMIKDCAISMAKKRKSIDDMCSAEAARLNYLISDLYQAKYPFQVKKILTLYRAVNYPDRLPNVLFSNIASPPVSKTKEMRMSKKGDSVFYGSTSIETTKKEASKDNNSKFTYIGEFKTKHPLRLLDLTEVPERLSIFDQEQYHLLAFFSEFCKAISEYIPEQDEIKYAPTQLVTYYFRHYLRYYESDGSYYPIDGILYTSSKDAAVNNAVLFYDYESCIDHLELVGYDCIEY